MYCTNCGKEVNVREFEYAKSSAEMVGADFNKETKVQYVCPRCGHLIHDNLEEQDIKSLSRAAHAEMQRGHNSFATGMGFNCIGIILLTIAIIFFTLSHKPSNHFKLSTTCVEFYVFLVLLVISVALLVSGIVFTSIGIYKRYKYSNLLKSIQNRTFVQ